MARSGSLTWIKPPGAGTRRLAGPLSRNGVPMPGVRRSLGLLLVAAATPKLCCVLPFAVAVLPALIDVFAVLGIQATLAQLDTLCSTGRAGALALLPLGATLVMFAAGALLTALPRRQRSCCNATACPG